MARYVYGIVHAGTSLPDLTGVGEPPGAVRLVERGEVAAVVSDLPDDTQLVEADAERHLGVLSDIVVKTGVLPMRFGTTAPDEETVREEVLGTAAADLLALLDELADDVELRIRLEFDEQATLRAVVDADPELRGLAGAVPRDFEDQLRIGEATAAAVTEWVSARGEELIEPIARHARRVHRIESTEPYTDQWAVLVPRADVSTMDEKVLRLATGGAHVSYVGPLPPYSFLDTEGRP